MENKPLIIYVGRFGLAQDAAGIRIFNNIKLLNSLGYRVICYCMVYSEKTTVKYSEDLTYIFQKQLKPQSKFSIVKSACELVLANKNYSVIKKLIEENHPEAVILYNDLFSLSYRLWRLSRNENFKLISDVSEWYEKKKYAKTFSDRIIPYLTDKRIRFIDPKIKRIIAISPYLVNFYKTKGCEVLFLPPLFDVNQNLEIYKHNFDGNRTINFLYAGSPGSKDILAPFIEALTVVNKDSIKVHFDIIGLSESEVNSIYYCDDYRKVGVYAHGRIKHEKVNDFLKKSDFGLLLRYQQRYAKAGFSTKFAECMSNGVAMFCNKVGGAETLITSGVDGFVIENTSASTIVQALKELCKKTDSEILEIKANALQKAKNLFDLYRYKTEMSDFITKK